MSRRLEMRRIIASSLVFSLLWLSGTLYAGKKGTKLIVQKTDGKQVMGELIVVKKSSILMKGSHSKVDVSVDISDIKMITVLKKSKPSLEAGSGLLTSVPLGAYADSSYGEAHSFAESGKNALASAFLFGILGTLLGTGNEGAMEIDNVIQVEGLSDLEIKLILEKLRKKARVTNFQ